MQFKKMSTELCTRLSPPKYIVVLKFGLAVLIEYDVSGSASPKYADLLICHVFILSIVNEVIL